MATRKQQKKNGGDLRAWPADRVERWPLARIKEYTRNARIHDEGQVRQIADSMRRFGVTAPVLVDEDGVLIYGHGRRRAAAMLAAGGWDLDGKPAPAMPQFAELPVVVAAGWSEDEKRAYRLADNQLALNSEWDMPTLKAELGALSLSGFDMPLLGFPEAKLVQFMAQPQGPEGFREFGEDVDVEHECPRCSYRWSGSSAPKEGGDGAAAAAKE